MWPISTLGNETYGTTYLITNFRVDHELNGTIILCMEGVNAVSFILASWCYFSQQKKASWLLYEAAYAICL